MLYTKPSSMSYTDLAIWIDNNKTDQSETFFNYLYALCEMLTRKKGYFQYQDEREDFAVYLATTVYNRYRSNEEQPKSVLNYIKSVIGYKKIDYTKEQWQQNITPEIIGDNKYNYELEDKLIQPSVSLLKVEFREYINQLFSVIRKEVQEYGEQNRVLRKNLYISTMLSFLNMVTLPVKQQERWNNITRSQTVKEKSLYRLHDELLESNYIILYHLTEEYGEQVRELLDRSVNRMKEEMMDTIREQFSLCSYYSGDIKNEFISCMNDEDAQEQDNYYSFE